MNNKTIEQFMLLHSLQSLSDQISKHEENLFRKTRLTKSEHRILLAIALHTESKQTPIKITDLIPYQNSRLVSVSLLVDRMEKKSLLKKIRLVSDQRIVSLTLTPNGENLLKEVSNPTTELIKRIFSILSDAELKQATLLINKLLNFSEGETRVPGDKIRKLTLEQRSRFFNKLAGY
jgi:DNA-binding MarR family transcriptional regulator